MFRRAPPSFAPGRPASAFAVVDLDSKRLCVRVDGAEAARYQFERG